MNERIDLTTSYPLPAPLVLFVEPTNVCNFQCSICPESLSDYADRAGYYQHMHPDTWANVRESLRDWVKMKVIRFYHTGEPLLNRDLPEMIFQAKDLAEQTEVTTNASVLDETRSFTLIAAGLDRLRISVYSTTNAGYELATGSRFKLDDILYNARRFRLQRDRAGKNKPFIYAELVSESSAAQRELFAQQWENLADSCGVKDMHNWGSALVTLGERPRPDKLVCPFPFMELAVKSNGDVTVCCVDWSNQLVVGNVNQTSLFGIWHGPRLKELRAVHLAGRRRDLNACRDCNVLHASPDNLDVLVPQYTR